MEEYFYKIYILKHPITGLIFYVGKTQGTIYARLFHHCYEYSNIKNPRNYKVEAILELAKSNRIPIIEQIDGTDYYKEALEKEKHWIYKLKKDGCPLTNKEVNPKRKYEIIYTDKYPYGICVVKGQKAPDEIVFFSKTRNRDEFNAINGDNSLRYKGNI